MKIVIVWGVSLFFCLSFVTIYTPINPSVNDNNSMAFQTGERLAEAIHEIYNPVYHIFSVIVAIIYGLYQRNKTQVVFFKNRNKISKFIIFLDYYSLLLPNFLFFCSLVILCVPIPLILHYLHTHQLNTSLTLFLVGFFAFCMFPIYPLTFIILFFLRP